MAEILRQRSMMTYPTIISRSQKSHIARCTLHIIQKSITVLHLRLPCPYILP